MPRTRCLSANYVKHLISFYHERSTLLWCSSPWAVDDYAFRTGKEPQSDFPELSILSAISGTLIIGINKSDGDHQFDYQNWNWQ